MLVFDEKKYAEELLNNGYKTYKNQGRERCILVRYLRSLDKDDNYIKKEMDKLSFSGKEYLSTDNLNIIYRKIINKASEFEYMANKQCVIYKSEIDIILGVDDILTRDLLFAYLVYYKWGCQGRHLYFDSKKNNKRWVVENDSDIFKIVGIFNQRKGKRYGYFNYLIDKKLYITDIINNTNMFYIPFSVDGGEIALTIDNYDNLIGWLYYYMGDYKLCAKCGSPIKKDKGNRQFCSNCSRDNRKKYIANKVREYRKNKSDN